ncbi:MAG: methyltransferase domain-containing protein [Pseudomonadota bacterium]
MALKTPWTAQLAANKQPDRESLRQHLLRVHQTHPGFTEACASRCRDYHGRSSYEWLADLVPQTPGSRVLDLACGSGALLEICGRRHGDALTLVGVDMSADELSLAKQRVGAFNVAFHEGVAQDLAFLPTNSFDIVFCHWALTVMDPVEPVFHEIARVLAPGGLFAAIVDGDPDLALHYGAVNDIIFNHVQRLYPLYGEIELGDQRIRTGSSLQDLARQTFAGAGHDISVEPAVFSMSDEPRKLAEEAAGFFYSSFVLPDAERSAMLSELTAFFESQGGEDRLPQFHLPVNRLVVRSREKQAVHAA